MFILCHHARYNLPISSDSLVTTIKPKARCKYHAAAMPYFYILQQID